MQVEFGQQFLFDVYLGVVGTEQETVRQNHCHTTVLLQTVHNDRHEEVCSFAACKVSGEMIFNICLFAAAVGRVHENHVKLIVHGVVQYVLEQGVVVEYTRNIQPMQQKVGDAKHIGELLFLDAVDGVAILLCISGALYLLLQLFQPADDKATGAAGKVRHCLTDLRLDHLCHKVGDSTGRIKLAGAACALELLQYGFINVTEGVAFLIIGKVQFVNNVNDLTEQDAVLHVVIGIGKGGLHDRFFDGCRCIYRQLLQCREQGVIHKVQKLIAGQGFAGFIIMRPILPTAGFRDNRLIVVIVKFPVLLLGIIYFKEKHPRNLLNALGIAVDTGIVAHDVTQSFHKS